MGRTLSRTLLLLLVLIAAMIPSLATADSGTAVLYFYCEKGNFLEVKGMVLFDITPATNDRTIVLDNMQPGQGKKECQVSPTYKVSLIISSNPEHSRGDGAVLIVDGDEVGYIPLDEPLKSYSYFFQRVQFHRPGEEEVRIDRTETTESSTTQHLTSEANPH